MGLGVGHYCFSKQTITEKQELLLKLTTTLRIGIGYDSLPRNGETECQKCLYFQGSLQPGLSFFLI